MIRDIHIRYGSMTDLFLLRANSATWQACTWQASCWQESIWQESSKSKAHMSKISLMMFLFIKFHCIPNDCEAERDFFFQRSTSSTFWRRGRRRPQRSEVEVIEADAPGKRLRKKHCRNVHRNELCHHRGRKTAYIDFKNWFLGRINMDGKVIYVCIYIWIYVHTHTRIYI